MKCSIILFFFLFTVKYWQQSRQQSTVILQYPYCEIILQFNYRKNEMQYNSVFFKFTVKYWQQESPAIYCNSTVIHTVNYLTAFSCKN